MSLHAAIWNSLDLVERSQFTITAFLVLAVLGIGCVLRAQEVQHLTTIHPGGFPGLPVVTGAFPLTNGFRVTWDGPSGYYRLFQRLGLNSPDWELVAGPSITRSADVLEVHPSAFFRVSGPAPRYAGSGVCLECHASIHSTEVTTPHAHALEILKRVNQDSNPSCLPCHTVGYGLPTGFISEAATPHLAGVQCESCHGPAANHAANEMDLTVRPRRELAAQVCGGCHNGSKHPTYEEWSGSGHGSVVFDVTPSRVESCGRCHSGSARLALLHGQNPSLTVANDGNVAITCAVCHDPHQQNVWTNVLTGLVVTNQLRNAVSSTNDFFLTTSDNFLGKYDPQINLCAQCHNHRGASWTSNSRPPHLSPQYNMLLGTIGELDAGVIPYRASHATRIDRQCVGCHMPTAPSAGEGSPALTGHSFQVERFESCLQCHSFPEGLVGFTQFAITNRMARVKADLDLWALTTAPLALRMKYGSLAWEYTSPGGLSVGGAGPSSSEQTQIPERIRKARFNLYVVGADGSYGVHNALHAVDLLDTARNWIQQEIEE